MIRPDLPRQTEFAKLAREETEMLCECGQLATRVARAPVGEQSWVRVPCCPNQSCGAKALTEAERHAPELTRSLVEGKKKPRRQHCWEWYEKLVGKYRGGKKNAK